MLISRHSALLNTNPETLLEILLDHDNLGEYFDAKFRILKPADAGAITGGQGCHREVRTFGITFIEKITSANSSGINYEIVGNFPMKNHKGSILFESREAQTWVTYEIMCEPLWYTPNIVIKYILDSHILTAFKRLT